MAHHVENVLGMKLDSGDKAFLLASQQLRLELARKALGRLAGTAVDTVRKLGVDYSLQKNERKLTVIRAERLTSGKKRWGTLVKLELKRQGAIVVHAGIVPHVTFGAELYAPGCADIKFINTTLGAVGKGRPLGVSNDFMIAVSPAARDPVFCLVEAVLGRWFRERWLLSALADKKPTDALDVLTLAKAARLIGGTEQIENAPILAIRWAIKQVGWTPKPDGTVFQSEREIEVKQHSPARLLKLAGDNRRSW